VLVGVADGELPLEVGAAEVVAEHVVDPLHKVGQHLVQIGKGCRATAPVFE
jgi:hypothetical protein